MRACEGCLNLTTFSLLKEPQILWCLRKTNSCFEDYVQAKTFFPGKIIIITILILALTILGILWLHLYLDSLFP